MGYVLGVDLGTTYSAAATAEGDRAERFPLGNRTPTIPSVVCLREDGEVLVGEAAERRALTEPGRTAREFKRRLGDPTPLILGGTPYGAEALSAHLLRWIVAKVSEQKGAAPDAIVLSHPANWGPYKLELLAQTVQAADVGEVSFITEPEAAAVHYAGQERLAQGEVVAVYDFGGGTFDAAVLRVNDADADGFELIGQPEGLERIGGIDFDQAIFAHVDAALGGAISELDPNDTSAMAAVQRLREECQLGKEQLSQDTDVDIPVLLPGHQTEIRLTRAEFETMIRPRISETIASLERAIRSAGLTADDVAKVLLVGGTSRVPLIGQMVQEATGRPIAVDAHPKFAIAIGAALTGLAGAARPTAEPVAVPAPDAASDEASVLEPSPPVPTATEEPLAPEPAAPEPPAPTPAPEPVAAPAPTPAAAAAPTPGADGDAGGRPPWIYAVVAVVAILLLGGIARALGGGKDASDPTAGSSPSASETVTDSPSTEPSSAQTTPELETLPAFVANPAPDMRFVEIEAIDTSEGRFDTTFRTYNLESSEHDIRFMWDDRDPLENEAEGLYHDHLASAGEFLTFSLLDRPIDADRLCAYLLDDTSSIVVDQSGDPYETGNCLEPDYSLVDTNVLPGNRFVEMTALDESGSRYVIDYTAHNFTPMISGGNHLHVFWYPTYSPDEVGVNVTPGSWTVWDTPGQINSASFDKSKRPADASHICVVVAEPDHTIRIQPDGTGYPSGNCVELSE